MYVASLTSRSLCPQEITPAELALRRREKSLAAEVNRTTVTWTRSMWLNHYTNCTVDIVSICFVY